MSGRFGEQAKVVGRAHQSFAEVPLPDAIDDYSRGERVPLGRDPGRQFAASAALGDRRLRITGEKRWHATRDHRAESRVTAPYMDRPVLNIGKQPAWHSVLLDG